MFTSSGRRPVSAPISGLLIILLGLFVVVVSAFLLVYPSGLPSFRYIPYLARFVPLIFLGVIALVWPLLAFLLMLLVMFGGADLNTWAKSLLPISPFWVLLSLTMAAQVARNIHRDRALPWNEALVMLLLILGAAIYELQTFSLSIHGILFPLLAGFGLIVSLGLLRSWHQVVFVIVALYLAFIILYVQLLPFFIPSWGTGRAVIREAALPTSLRQALSLDWLFNAVALLSLGMAVRTRGRLRMLLLALFALLAAASILTFSRGAFLGLGAGMLALLLIEGRGPGRSLRWFFVAAICVWVVGYYSGALTYNLEYRGLDRELRLFQEGTPGRVSDLVNGLKAMPKHWIIGAGPLSGVGAHSSLLDMWIEYGGIYAIAFWVFIFALFRRSYRMARGSSASTSDPRARAITLGLCCSFAGSIANSLFDFTFFSLVYGVVFWTMRGLEIAIWKSGLAMATDSQRHRQLPGSAIAGPTNPPAD